MGRSEGKSAVFQVALKHAQSAGKLVKKETIGGITTETIEGKDGRQWLFAYRAKNNVISSHMETKRLAESLTL